MSSDIHCSLVGLRLALQDLGDFITIHGNVKRTLVHSVGWLRVYSPYVHGSYHSETIFLHAFVPVWLHFRGIITI